MSGLRDAFREAVRREFENIPPEDEADWAFSVEFQKQIEELISEPAKGRCFFIGHRDAPSTLMPFLDQAIELSVSKHHIHQFVVGAYGNFDKMAMEALIKAKRNYPELQLLYLTPYYPSEKRVILPSGFDATFYPEGMETVPRRFAIVHANQYMIDHCDRVIAYVNWDRSNAGKLLRRAKNKGVEIDNLAEHREE